MATHHTASPPLYFIARIYPTCGDATPIERQETLEMQTLRQCRVREDP